MSNSSTGPIDSTLSGATTLGQRWPGSNGIEKSTPHSYSSKTGASPSDCLVSCRGLLLGVSLTS